LTHASSHAAKDARIFRCFFVKLFDANILMAADAVSQVKSLPKSVTSSHFSLLNPSSTFNSSLLLFLGDTVGDGVTGSFGAPLFAKRSSKLSISIFLGSVWVQLASMAINCKLGP